jgi:hypothetical protein
MRNEPPVGGAITTGPGPSASGPVTETDGDAGEGGEGGDCEVAVAVGLALLEDAPVHATGSSTIAAARVRRGRGIGRPIPTTLTSDPYQASGVLRRRDMVEWGPGHR